MNNEDKILSILEQLQQGQVRTDARLDDIQGDIRELKDDVQILKDDVQILKDDVQILKDDVQILKDDVQILKDDVQILKDDVQILKEDVKVLKADVHILKEDVQVLQTDMVEVKNRLTCIEVTQENVTNKHIGLILDRNVDITRKLKDVEKLPEQFEEMEMTVSVLKQAVKKISAVS